MQFCKLWKFWIIEYFQILDSFQSWFMIQNASKIQIHDMCENGKPLIVSKMDKFLLKMNGPLTI